jgi:hypothetical protein
VRRIAATIALALFLAGCGQFDEVASFEVMNDGNVPVVVVQCGNTCGKHHQEARVRPGASTPFNASVGGPAEYFLVRDGRGKNLGCLTVLLKRAVGEPRVPTSSAQQCDRHLLSKGSWWDRTFG